MSDFRLGSTSVNLELRPTLPLYPEDPTLPCHSMVKLYRSTRAIPAWVS